MRGVQALLSLLVLSSAHALRFSANGIVASGNSLMAGLQNVLNDKPSSFKTCRHPDAAFLQGERVSTPRPHELMSVNQLPEAWFWGNVNGSNYLTETRNQHIPQYCGSCWAFGTTSAMSDRLRIKYQDRFPEVVLSSQVLVNCRGGGSCEGGNPYAVYEYIAENGLPDETCQNYEAVDGECRPFGVCETCSPGQTPEKFLPGTCKAIQKYTRYSVSEYGHAHSGADADRNGAKLTNADKIKAEIVARGPVACGIYVTDKFEAYEGGIYSEWTLLNIPNHELSLVGYGVEDGVEYWIGRNSWGTYWGEDGFFRIKMHSNNLGIENTCSWADPIILEEALPPQQEEAIQSRGSYSVDTRVQTGTFHDYKRPGLVRSATPVPTHVVSPPPHTLLSASDIPAAYDIRNLAGVDYASINRNQHIPQYCGSCWAHSTSSALNDRISLQRGGLKFPEIDLSPQVLVDCVTENSAGCSGGDPTAAYAYIYEHGITDETCSNYQAMDKACSAISVCKSCDWDGCWAIPPSQHRTYTIEEHGTVSGEADIMAEITARGPVSAGICVTEELEAYTGGIFEDKTGATCENHAVVIGGWDEEGGIPYWIVRNSWGTYWGEGGWLRIRRSQGSLGLERFCDWAVPSRVPADSFPSYPTTPMRTEAAVAA